MVDRETRIVSFHDREFSKVAFPSASDKEAAWLEVLRKEVTPQARELALDRLAAMLELTEADKVR
ncbi:MAG TPA: hypothetical protein VKA01_02090, partial [Vicinamibacteria bacterium]|nr:hypothetical protein [Vicinamibacteria bacterium]